MSDYDLIVVGAGTAGMVCASEAARRGLRVAAFEKDDRIGGALHWSGGHMSAGGTRRQRARGIDDSVADHLADIRRINGGSGDPALIEKAARLAPGTIDWLEDLGFAFAPECPRVIYGHVPYDRPRTHYGVNKALSILEVIRPLWDEQVAAGRLELFAGRAVDELLTDGGRVTGVRAGQRTARAPHVVLTTGGYGSNPELFAELHPGVHLLSTAYPTATGDGHLLARRAGAVLEYADCFVPSLGGVELSPGRADFNRAWAMLLTSVYRPAREIYLDGDGHRFMDENEANADTRERTVLERTQGFFWAVFDQAALDWRSPTGAENPLMIGWDQGRTEAEANRGGFLHRANSLDELARATGLPTTTLRQSVAKWNDCVASGHDPAFGRAPCAHPLTTPPYYALKTHYSVLVTFAGLRADPGLRVLDAGGRPIPGLYAAGEALGLGATSGNAFCSGMAITPALAFGRWLGQTLESETLR